MRPCVFVVVSVSARRPVAQEPSGQIHLDLLAAYATESSSVASDQARSLPRALVTLYGTTQQSRELQLNHFLSVMLREATR